MQTSGKEHNTIIISTPEMGTKLTAGLCSHIPLVTVMIYIAVMNKANYNFFQFCSGFD